MKGFIFDENVPARLSFIPSLRVVHATDLGDSVTDSELWDHARKNEFAIISKDTDFSNRIMLCEPPPWIVHLRIGNMRKQEFHAFLVRVWGQIEALLPENKLIIVFADRIEAIK